jgi:hypothetical protein
MITAKTKKDAQANLNQISEMLDVYTEWGYTEDLNEVVDVLYDCYKKLKEIYKQSLIAEVESL